MTILQAKVAEIADKMKTEQKALAKQHGDLKIGDVTVGQVLGGMRGITSLLCDTSIVLPDEGLRIRNIPILELTKNSPEEIFFLLCTGQFPDDEAKAELNRLFAENAEVPSYVWDVINAMPADSHPMTMLNTAILCMERESKFRAAYDEGTAKDKLWIPMLEDSIILLSRITSIAAAIYRKRFGKGERIAPKDGLDWGGNFAHMLGIDDPHGKFADLVRLYLVLHSDHEAGNVSAATSITVGSALSDAYYAVSAGLNGLAGPLHGLANQECLKFVQEVYSKLGGVPTVDTLKEYLWNRLNNGQVVPGFGHAVLRVEDPRFTAFYQFGKENCADDEIFQTVDLLYQTAPKVLLEHGKAKNVYPNVDAASGSLLYYYGMKEFEFYTVMFSVSRAMGICSQLITNRAILAPIVRPKAVTTDDLKEMVAKATA